MGTGKSSVGRATAELLGWRFIDLDSAIEDRLGMTVAECFDRLGEEAFRVYESKALEEAAQSPAPAVIACGGGVVVSEVNWERMRATGTVLCLTAPLDVILERLGDDSTRPLLPPACRRERAAALLAERAHWYARADGAVESAGCVACTAARVCAA